MAARWKTTLVTCTVDTLVGRLPVVDVLVNRIYRTHRHYCARRPEWTLMSGHGEAVPRAREDMVYEEIAYVAAALVPLTDFYDSGNLVHEGTF